MTLTGILEHKDRVRLWVLMLLSLIATASSLLDPLILKFIIDDVLSSRRFHLLLPAIVFLLLAKLISLLLVYVYGMAFERLIQSVTLSLRHRLFERITFMTYQAFRRYDRGDLIRLLTTDVSNIRSLLSAAQRVFVHSARLCVILIFVASLNATVVGFLILVMPLYAFVQRRYQRTLRTQAESMAHADIGVLNFFTTRLPNYLLVKTSVQEKRELDSQDRLTRKQSELTIHYLSKVLRSLGLIGAITALTIAGLFFGGGIAVAGGAMTIGTLVALFGYTIQLFEPLSGLVSIPLGLQDAWVSSDRVKTVLSHPDQEPRGEHVRCFPLQGTIEFDRVSFAYPDQPDRLVLDDVSFRINAGETVAVIGETGGGKSSIALLLLRFYEPTAGSILFDGRPLTDYSPGYLRSRIGFMSQRNVLLPETIMENILYAAPEGGCARAEDAARKAAIHDRILRLPQGYDTMVGTDGGAFSEGEKQRLSLARVLAQDPDLFLFDEPTASLDAKTGTEVMQAVRRAAQGKTTIIVTHRPSEVPFADKVLRLEGGRANFLSRSPL
ncbi:ABC transporter ATP-binding protein [Candidatus Uhrbacteria bacterium]|nr:MAG: ABC transporter ATP-binding protein [Candidatus Uhrbacteria bacterium]